MVAILWDNTYVYWWCKTNFFIFNFNSDKSVQANPWGACLDGRVLSVCVWGAGGR